MSLQTTLAPGTIRGAGQPLSTVSRDLIFRQLNQHGYLLLRDFRTTLPEFSEFVQARSKRLSLDPARAFHDAEGRPVAQKVDAGTDAIGLHCENGNSPFMPDLCWFYCETAAADGSQTTVCDGVTVFDSMSNAAQRAFLVQDIVYSRRVASALWQSFVRHGSAGEVGGDDTATLFARLKGLANDDSKTQLELNDDGSVFYRFQVSAITRRSPFRDEYRAFANSIFGPSYNYERPVITFADGAAIPAHLLAEAAARCAESTRDIDWQNGDVVILDNRRVMHGRRAITDTRRCIYNALSYV